MRPFAFCAAPVARFEKTTMTGYPVHGRIEGPIAMIGFGSIWRGMLPLIERHFENDYHQLVVVEPPDERRLYLVQRGIRHIQVALTSGSFATS